MTVFRCFSPKTYLQGLICITLIICTSNRLAGNEVLRDSILKQFEKVKEIHSIDSKKAQDLLTTTLELTQRNAYRKGEMLTHEQIGYYLFLENRMEEAISSYQKALRIAEELKDRHKQSMNLHHIANVYMRIGRLEKALSFVEQAYDQLEKGTDLLLEGYMFSTSASIKAQMGKEEKEVIDTYMQSYELFESIDDKKMKNVVLSNISYYYLLRGNGEKAFPYILQSLTQNEEMGNVRGITINHGNLGYAYFLLGDDKQAFEHYQMCVDSAQKYNWARIEYDTYKDMSDTYLESGNSKEALIYFKKYHKLRDSIIGQETQNRIADLEVQFEAERSERKIQELQQSQQIQGLQLGLLGGGLALLAIIAFFVFNKMRSDIREKQALLAKNKEIHRLEKELMENQLQQKEIEQEQAKAKLAYQTQHLTDFALDIAQKNQLSNDLMAAIVNIEKKSIPKMVSDELRKIQMLISSHLRINEGVAAFQQHVDEVHLEFNHKLKQFFPELTEKDIILCGLLRLNLQNKEIAIIRGVSDNAVKMARYRLRKKLGLTEQDEIVAFLKVI